MIITMLNLIAVVSIVFLRFYLARVIAGDVVF